MEKGAFNHDLHDRRASTPTGSTKDEQRHRELMKEAGFLRQVTRRRRCGAAVAAAAVVDVRSDEAPDSPAVAARRRDRRRRCSCCARRRRHVDSLRLGIGWGERRPAGRLFPVLHRRCIVVHRGGWSNFVAGAAAHGARRRRLFVERGQLRLVLTVLIPTVVYVGADPLARHLRRLGALHRAASCAGSASTRWLQTLCGQRRRADGRSS